MNNTYKSELDKLLLEARTDEYGDSGNYNEAKLKALITQQFNQASRNRAQEVLNNLNTGIFFESSNPKPQFVKDCIMFELDKLEAERLAEFDEKRSQAKETEETHG